jgi:lipoate---protein ligase
MARRAVRLLTSRDAFANLAAEERLFLSAPPNAHTLLFYVNNPTIVVGRTQNPFFECDIAQAASTSVSIARRRSGGGTVVHDAGNLNFCFTAPRDAHDPTGNSRLIVDALLAAFGISADVTKRGDITVNGRKVSGAAFRLTRDRAYHHGTLLVKSDLPNLRALLQSPLREGLRVTGAPSVSSPVANLVDHAPGIDIPAVIAAIAGRFDTLSGLDVSIDEFTPEAVERYCDANETVSGSRNGLDIERCELAAPSWVYGQIPRFSYTVPDPCSLASSSTSPLRMLRVYMSKGGVINSVHAVNNNGVPSSAQQGPPIAGAVPTNDDGEEDRDLTTLLHGVLFDGSRISAQIERTGDQRLKDSVKALARGVPVRHVQNS